MSDDPTTGRGASSSIMHAQVRIKLLLTSAPPPSQIINQTFLLFYRSANVSANTRMLNIMTNKPMVTMISNANANQPSTIAVVPTPLFTLPFPKSCAIIEAATDAVCCQSTETSTKIEAMKIMARAIWETGLDGKGLTSRSLPRSSSSSCQPGKVARSKRQTNANTIATILFSNVSRFSML